MKYNSEPSKIYDVSFWLMDHYFPEQTKKTFFSVFEDTVFMRKCLEEVTEKIDKIPDLLAPFAFSENGTTSALLVFLNKEFCHHQENITLDLFLDDLLNNKNELYKSFISVIFGKQYEENDLLKDTSEYIKAIEDIYAPIDIKLKTSLILNDFDYAVGILAETVKKVYDVVEELYLAYDKEIQYIYGQIRNEYNIELYKKAFDYSEENFDETIVSIPLLNQFVVLHNFHEKNAFLLLGYKHIESFWNKGNTKTVDPRRFIITSGNDTRIEILDLIAQHGKITISSLAKIMDIPITTVGRHVSSLRNDNIIFISHRDGLQLFYSINTCYFKRLKIAMVDYIDEMVRLAKKNKKN